MVFLNILAGLGLGTFVALLIALSNSPVVASALSVLLAASVLFLALNERLPIPRASEMSVHLLWRIITFSAAASVALLLGLNHRVTITSNGSQLAAEYANLLDIGLDENRAREAAVSAFVFRSSRHVTEKERILSTFSLFSTSGTEVDCLEMEPGEISDVSSIRTKYDSEGGQWSKVVRSLDEYLGSNNSVDPRSFFLGSYSALCNR